MELESGQSCGNPRHHVASAFDPSPNIPAAAQPAPTTQKPRLIRRSASSRQRIILRLSQAMWGVCNAYRSTRMPRPQHFSTASWCSGNKLSIARNRALNQVLVLSNELNTSAVRRRHVPQRLPLLGRGADPDPVNQRRVMAGLSEQFDLSSTNGGTVSPISEPGPFVLLITGLSGLPWCGIGVRDRAGVPAEALGARLRRAGWGDACPERWYRNHAQGQ